MVVVLQLECGVVGGFDVVVIEGGMVLVWVECGQVGVVVIIVVVSYVDVQVIGLGQLCGVYVYDVEYVFVVVVDCNGVEQCGGGGVIDEYVVIFVVVYVDYVVVGFNVVGGVVGGIGYVYVIGCIVVCGDLVILYGGDFVGDFDIVVVGVGLGVDGVVGQLQV